MSVLNAVTDYMQEINRVESHAITVGLLGLPRGRRIRPGRRRGWRKHVRLEKSRARRAR
jgi:hypothetical protein